MHLAAADNAESIGSNEVLAEGVGLLICEGHEAQKWVTDKVQQWSYTL